MTDYLLQPNESLHEILSTILDETSFDLNSTEIVYDGKSRRLPRRRVSPSELREFYYCRERRIVHGMVVDSARACAGGIDVSGGRGTAGAPR